MYIHYKKGNMYRKGDNCTFIFARIMPPLGLRILSEILTFLIPQNITKRIDLEFVVYPNYQTNMFEQAATAERWHPHAVLLFIQSKTLQQNILHLFS